MLVGYAYYESFCFPCVDFVSVVFKQRGLILFRILPSIRTEDLIEHKLVKKTRAFCRRVRVLKLSKRHGRRRPAARTISRKNAFGRETVKTVVRSRRGGVALTAPLKDRYERARLLRRRNRVWPQQMLWGPNRRRKQPSSNTTTTTWHYYYHHYHHLAFLPPWVLGFVNFALSQRFEFNLHGAQCMLISFRASYFGVFFLFVIVISIIGKMKIKTPIRLFGRDIVYNPVVDYFQTFDGSNFA